VQVLAAGGVWRDAGRLSEAALAQQIRQDQIDILVELTGGWGCVCVGGGCVWGGGD